MAKGNVLVLPLISIIVRTFWKFIGSLKTFNLKRRFRRWSYYSLVSCPIIRTEIAAYGHVLEGKFNFLFVFFFRRRVFKQLICRDSQANAWVHAPSMLQVRSKMLADYLKSTWGANIFHSEPTVNVRVRVLGRISGLNLIAVFFLIGKRNTISQILSPMATLLLNSAFPTGVFIMVKFPAMQKLGNVEVCELGVVPNSKFT